MAKNCNHVFVTDRAYKDEATLEKCVYCDFWRASFYEGTTCIYTTQVYDLPYRIDACVGRYNELLKRNQGYLYISMLELLNI